jgi:hypothetical protein
MVVAHPDDEDRGRGWFGPAWFFLSAVGAVFAAAARVGSWSLNGIFSGRRAAVRLSVKLQT